MMDSVKERDSRLWEMYAGSGLLPEVRMSEAEAHDLLANAYAPFLSLLLAGNALAGYNSAALDDTRGTRIANAFSAVLNVVRSKKRNYSRKEEMESALIAFSTNSKLGLLKTNSGFYVAKKHMEERSEERAKEYAAKIFARLETLMASSPIYLNLSEFVPLSVSIGWRLVKSDWKGEEKLLRWMDEANKDTYWCEKIDELKKRIANRAQQSLWDLSREWEDELKKGNPSKSVLTDVLRRMLPFVGTDVWKSCYKDTTMRIIFLQRLAFLISRKTIDLAGTLGFSLIQLLQKDGLEHIEYTSLCERKPKVPPPEDPRVSRFWPSAVERFGKFVYTVCKERYAKNGSAADHDSVLLNWTIDFLKRLGQQVRDDDWLSYRLGKIMVWAGRKEEARSLLLPVIRNKRSEFWAWELLGDLFPENRRACIARSLLCRGQEEKYLTAVIRAGESLGLSREHPDELKQVATGAEDCLLESLPRIPGVLVGHFETKEGKVRWRLSDGSGRVIRPISTSFLNLGKAPKDGTPVYILFEDGADRKVAAVIPRPESEKWDILPSEKAVFLHWSTDSHNVRFAVGMIAGAEFRAYALKETAKPGQPLLVRFSDCTQEDHDPECVWSRFDSDPERSFWDVCRHEEATYLKSYKNDRGWVYYFYAGQTYTAYDVPRNLAPGEPVRICLLGDVPESGSGRRFRHRNDNPRAYGVLPDTSETRSPWDKLVQTRAVCGGAGREPGTWRFLTELQHYTVRENLCPQEAVFAPGKTFELLTASRKNKKTGKTFNDVYCCREVADTPVTEVPFSGMFRLPDSGERTVGYVDLYEEDEMQEYREQSDDEFVPPPHSYGSVLVPKELLEAHSLKRNTHVRGMAVRLPDRIHVSKAGNTYRQQQYYALRIDSGNL